MNCICLGFEEKCQQMWKKNVVNQALNSSLLMTFGFTHNAHITIKKLYPQKKVLSL